MLSELESYLQRLEDLRGMARDVIADLPAEALNWRPIEGAGEESTNSLAVLAAHVAGVEHFWVAEVIGGHPRTRDRVAEFATQAEAASDLVRRFEEVGAETREVFATLAGDELNGTREVEGRVIPVRWAMAHAIEHSALHLGHMQITYQLWTGGPAKASVRWTERLRSLNE